MFFAGLFLKYVMYNPGNQTTEFDYGKQDSLFSAVISADTIELIQKKVDSEQELLDFNTYELNLSAKSDRNLLPSSVDINSATSEELIKLPGIGEKTAGAIIKFREEHGKFKTIESIMAVKGIGKRKFENIRKFIIVK